MNKKLFTTQRKMYNHWFNDAVMGNFCNGKLNWTLTEIGKACIWSFAPWESHHDREFLGFRQNGEQKRNDSCYNMFHGHYTTFNVSILSKVLFVIF